MKRSGFLFKKIAPFLLVFLLVQQAGCTVVLRKPYDPPKTKKANLYRGVYHVHSIFSHDSRATLNYISKTGQQAGLDFIVVTDHNNIDARDAAQPLAHDPLLIFGTELSMSSDGHLINLGVKEPLFNLKDTKAVVEAAHRQGGFAFPAHPVSKRKPWTNWTIQNFDGLEVFSFSDFIYEHNVPALILKFIFLPSGEFLKSVLSVNPKNLKLWDDHLKTGERMTGFGSVDAHLKYQVAGISIDNLLMSFQAVTMYVASDELKEEKIIDALVKGRSFIALEAFGAAQEFSFSASQDGKTYGSGETLKIGTPIQLTVKSPKAATIRLIHNGAVLAEENGSEFTHEASEKGYYRVEVLLAGKIWILSNPVYIE